MRIWFALLAAPILALTDQSIAYAMTGWACAHQQAVALHGVHLVFFAASVAGTIAAWGLWRATTPSQTRSETLARRHVLAGLGGAVRACDRCDVDPELGTLALSVLTGFAVAVLPLAALAHTGAPGPRGACLARLGGRPQEIINE